ncbi:MAG: pirin family protein [Methanocorpusculum sp.]|nr:pirin family protein [Methanocorpusculum sp.]
MYHGHRVPGFPEHPHRGFETVTVTLRGYVDHSDSLGSAGRYGNGDVQWMTAGSGCQHAEMFSLIHQYVENPLDFQIPLELWLNLPRKDKFTEPAYTMFWSEEIPEVATTDARGNECIVRVIAGSFQGMQAPEPPATSWGLTPPIT